jgi:hypothetical protein
MSLAARRSRQESSERAVWRYHLSLSSKIRSP